MNNFIAEQGLGTNTTEEESEEETGEEEVSAVDLDRQLSEKRKGKR